MKLTVVTISCRHHFLPMISKSISDAVIPADVDLQWLVKYNPPIKLPPAEHLARWDALLAGLKNTWWLLLSDDNLLHPQAIQRWHEMVVANPQARIVHFAQKTGPLPTSVRPAGLEHVDGGKCDGGQFFIDADFYNSFGWSYEQYGFEGNLFKEMIRHSPESYVAHNEQLTFHDRIYW